MRLILSFLMILSSSCAVDYDKNKKVTKDTVLGEYVLKQEGKVVNKFSVIRELNKNPKNVAKLEGAESNLTLAYGGAGAGGALLAMGLIQSNTGLLIVAGGLIGAGYYFITKADQQLIPLIDEQNKKLSWLPDLFILPAEQGSISGMNLRFSF
jgi:hypothetical protein